MKALLYLFLLLGSTFAAADVVPGKQGDGAHLICDLSGPIADQVPLPGEDRVALPVSHIQFAPALFALPCNSAPAAPVLAQLRAMPIRAPPTAV